MKLFSTTKATIKTFFVAIIVIAIWYAIFFGYGPKKEQVDSYPHSSLMQFLPENTDQTKVVAISARDGFLAWVNNISPQPTPFGNQNNFEFFVNDIETGRTIFNYRFHDDKDILLVAIYKKNAVIHTRDNKLILIDIDKNKVSQVMGAIENVALGDGIVTWITQSTNPNVQGYATGRTREFDVWLNNFENGTMKLIKRFNNGNPNTPNVAVSGKKIAVVTYENKLILIDANSENVEEIDIPWGYKVDHDSLLYINNSIIFGVDVGNSFNTTKLVKYDVVKKRFNTITNVTPSFLPPWCYKHQSINQ